MDEAASTSAQTKVPHTASSLPLPLSILHVVCDEPSPRESFACALKLALMSQGSLEVIDIRKEKEGAAELGVRSFLEQWGVLAKGAAREDVITLGLKVKKLVKAGCSKRDVGKRMQRAQHDILVIAAQPERRALRLFGADLAEYLGTHVRQTTLYIPGGLEPLVDPATGRFRLSRILACVAQSPSFEPALSFLIRLVELFPPQSLSVAGLHIGHAFPEVPSGALTRLPWRGVLRAPSDRSVAQEIASAARTESADLIVMSTNGRDTLSKKLLGSTTEEVLRLTPCPLLAVPST